MAYDNIDSRDDKMDQWEFIDEIRRNFFFYRIVKNFFFEV